MFDLTVIQDFHHRGFHWHKGDHIDDQELVDEILRSEMCHYVTKVSSDHDDVLMWKRRVDAAFKPVSSHEENE